MQDKNWYESRTIWSGIAIVGIGFCQYYGLNLPYEIVYTVLGGFGLYGVRAAIGAQTKVRIK